MKKRQRVFGYFFGASKKNGRTVRAEMSIPIKFSVNYENKFVDDGIVKEIVVRGEKDTIIAEIFPDETLAETMGITDIPAEISKIVDRVNSSLNTDRHIHSFVIRETPFERTSTGKIKRAVFNFAEDESK